MTFYLQRRAGSFFCSYSWEHYKIIIGWGLSIGPHILTAWVKLCVFSRALQLKVGTDFAGLGQENMPPLLPPTFLYLLLSGGALQTAKCLLHPPSKLPLHHPLPGLTPTLCLCLPPQAAASCEPQLCISFSPCSLGVLMPSFRQGCTSSLEYNWKQNLIVLSSRSCFYY